MRPLALLCILWALASVATAQPAATPRAEPELVVRASHTGPIDALTFSPDGQVIATGGRDGTVRLWDARARLPFRILTGSTLWITSLAYSPDGKILASANGAGQVTFWDPHTGKALRTLTGHDPTPPVGTYPPDRPKVMRTRIAFNHQGNLLASTSHDKRLIVWSVDSGEEVERLDGIANGASGLAFNPDDTLLAVGGADGEYPQVVFLRTKDWSEYRRVRTRYEDSLFGGCNNVSFDPDGGMIYASGPTKDGPGLAVPCTIVWDVRSGKRIDVIENLDRQGERRLWPGGASFLSQDGRFRASTIGDAVVRLSRRAGTAPPILVRSARGRVSAMAFSPDGKTLATGTDEAALALWDTDSGRGEEIPAFGSAVTAVRFLSEDVFAVCNGSSPYAMEWETNTARLLRTPGPFKAPPSILVKDGPLLAIGGAAGVQLWDDAGGQPAGELPGVIGDSDSLAFSPQGKVAAFGAAGVIRGMMLDVVNLYSVEKKATLLSIENRPFPVSCVAFSPDGQVLASGSMSSVKLWNSRGKEIATLQGNSGSITGLRFASGGKKLIVSSGDGLVALWDLAMRQIIHEMPARHGSVIAMDYSEQAGLIAAACSDGWIVLWDFASGREVRQIPAHTSSATAVSFSPSGGKIISGGIDGTVRLFDTASGTLLATFVSLSPEQTLVATNGNFYQASRAGLRAVGFRVSDHAYPFEQFDLRLNRPDLVLSALHGDRTLIAAYRAAYERRLRRLNLSPEILGSDAHVPEIQIATSDIPVSTALTEIPLRIKAADSLYKMAQLRISVNDVPVYGAGGLSLKTPGPSSLERDLRITLTPGRNRIDVSVLNDRGAESLKQTVEITCTAPAVKPDLYLVVVGVSQYKNPAYNLKMAAKDAKDVATYFEERAGMYGSVKVLPLLDAEATSEGIRKAKAFLMGSRPTDQAVVFVSGHGLLDPNYDYYFATTNVDLRDLSRTALPYSALEDLLDGIPARRKLLLMDTCHAGEVDRESLTYQGGPAAGGKSIDGGQVITRDLVLRKASTVPKTALGLQNSFDLMKELFANLELGSGAQVIASSAGAELSFESPQWNNGVFTYALLQGLQSGAADKDKDGQVMVSELNDYVSDTVSRLTDGRQKPTSRRESVEFDFPIASAAAH